MALPVSSSRYINEFFEAYAHAFETYDTKQMANIYFLPCTLLSDDATTPFTEASKLEGFFNQGAAFYKQFGVAHVHTEVWSKHAWTEKIIKAKVNWQFYNKDNQPLYNCDYEYVLMATKPGTWKIVLSVSVNEKERMEEWQANNKPAKTK